MPTGRSKLMYRNWVTEWCSYLMDGHLSSMSPKKVKGPRVARASAGDNVPIFPSLDSIGATWKFAQSSHRVVRLRPMGLSYLIKSCSKSVTQKKTLPSHRPIFHDTGLIGEQILKSDGQNPYKPIILPHFFENAPSKNHPGHRPSPVAPAAAVVVALRVLARAVRAPEVKIGRITWKSEKLWGNHKSSCTKLCFSHLCKRPSKHSGCCTVCIYIYVWGFP